MKKRFICLSVLLASSFLAGFAAAADKGAVTWKLKYTENFNGNKLRDALWVRIDKGKSDWNRDMYVDWVKFYEGSRGGKKFTEFVRPGK